MWKVKPSPLAVVPTVREEAEKTEASEQDDEEEVEWKRPSVSTGPTVG